MEKYRDYKDMLVWKKSMDLAEKIYHLTGLLPSDQRFRLIDQVQRAVVSVPSNIAEGSRRFSIKENKRFLRIAFGSASELETQLILLKRIYPPQEKRICEIEKLLLEVLKMLNKLSR